MTLIVDLITGTIVWLPTLIHHFNSFNSSEIKIYFIFLFGINSNWPCKYFFSRKNFMEDVPCSHCGSFFVPSARHKNQNYCMRPDCRRAKKAAWKRKKMRIDPDFKLGQQLSNKKWAKANQNYWKEYRLGKSWKNRKKSATSNCS